MGAQVSILSTREDGYGFYYGFRGNDTRQINVRFERIERDGPGHWHAYVGGYWAAVANSKDEAEAKAISWMDKHPERNPAEAKA